MATSQEALKTGVPLLVPTYAEAYYTTRITLDGRVFTLEFAWNQREQAWYLGVLDESEERVISGIKVISNWPLLDWYKWDTRLPDGEFVAHDLTGSYDNPGYDDFGIGKRVEFTYYAVVP